MLLLLTPIIRRPTVKFTTCTYHFIYIFINGVNWFWGPHQVFGGGSPRLAPAQAIKAKTEYKKVTKTDGDNYTNRPTCMRCCWPETRTPTELFRT